MAETLSATLTSSLIANLALADPNATASYPLTLTALLNLSLTSGTGDHKVNQLYSSQRTLASSASEAIDLFAFAAALDPLGQTYAQLTVKVLCIQNLSTTPSDFLTIGNQNDSTTWTSFLGSITATCKVRGGGMLLVTAPDATGMVVVNTTNQKLKILNSGVGSITYNIFVIGATA